MGGDDVLIGEDTPGDQDVDSTTCPNNCSLGLKSCDGNGVRT